MAAGKIIGLTFGIIALIGLIFVIQNGLKDIEDAEKWMAYEYGVCRFIDGWSEQRCLVEGGEVVWPGLNGKESYGENPRLGLGIGEN